MAPETESQNQEPPRFLILPTDSSPDARICTLAHPRTLNPSRYYFDPAKGVYEFTRVAAPKSSYRSWLLAGQGRRVSSKTGTEGAIESASTEKPEDAPQSEASPTEEIDDGNGNQRPISGGYTIKNADLLVATPIDFLFLLLPSFGDPLSPKSSTPKNLFLPADDLLEKLCEASRHFGHLSRHEPTRAAMEARMQVVCDMVDAGDEKMYRLNDEKLLSELLLKAKGMVAKGLPASMEERFIRKALETPVMGIRHEESTFSDANPPQADTLLSETASLETVDSQASTATAESTSSVLSTGTDITIPDEIVPATEDSKLYHLLRVRTALSYMVSAYVPPPLAATLNTLLVSDKSPIDFKLLNERLASIARLRAEAFASRSLGDFSRKRSMYEEDEAVETRVEKKRKKEEEEKKKKLGESRGIRDLKKVDTKGMKKMSDFFGKGAAVNKK